MIQKHRVYLKEDINKVRKWKLKYLEVQELILQLMTNSMIGQAFLKIKICKFLTDLEVTLKGSQQITNITCEEDKLKLMMKI